ncbi:hypothetical protein P7K49_032556 [Saguinus oedipus]|uniref:Uncharacterized protein n=1 Tax=Saguinus oedipus TaxID=9490 RepID=A0ABQ9TZI1_SAGOE|nr:hypothetical protein P7K49_032556 [Saguinus oedipus]
MKRKGAVPAALFAENVRFHGNRMQREGLPGQAGSGSPSRLFSAPSSGICLQGNRRIPTVRLSCLVKTSITLPGNAGDLQRQHVCECLHKRAKQKRNHTHAIVGNTDNVQYCSETSTLTGFATMKQREGRPRASVVQRLSRGGDGACEKITLKPLFHKGNLLVNVTQARHDPHPPSSKYTGLVTPRQLHSRRASPDPPSPPPPPRHSAEGHEGSETSWGSRSSFSFQGAPCSQHTAQTKGGFPSETHLAHFALLPCGIPRYRVLNKNGIRQKIHLLMFRVTGKLETFQKCITGDWILTFPGGALKMELSFVQQLGMSS